MDVVTMIVLVVSMGALVAILETITEDDQISMGQQANQNAVMLALEKMPMSMAKIGVVASSAMINKSIVRLHDMTRQNRAIINNMKLVRPVVKEGLPARITVPGKIVIKVSIRCPSAEVISAMDLRISNVTEVRALHLSLKTARETHRTISQRVLLPDTNKLDHQSVTDLVLGQPLHPVPNLHPIQITATTKQQKEERDIAPRVASRARKETHN